jgi:predicted ATPase with chaperone activity
VVYGEIAAATVAMSTDTQESYSPLLAAILSDEVFLPALPHTVEETGLPASLIESLVVKYLSVVGHACGRAIGEQICLPFGILEGLLQGLRTRQVLVHTAAAPVNDYYYMLTEQGRERAQAAMNACGYVGPAPVPLTDYVLSVDAQTIRAEAPKRHELEKAFADISVDPNLFESLGPAVNSGAGLFLYGSPGNGKSTLARRITACFGQEIWIPHAVTEDGQLIKVYDQAYHQAVKRHDQGLLKATEHDSRWVRIRRPTVVVGGEMTMDSLEIRHDPRANVSEAPLQMKSNCGCLLIDDFGRQRVEPEELLNRWIVPLENRHDFLTLSTGKKIQVPFEQLIIFSTNLEPSDLVDEAFLRRIPYKIEIGDPSVEEFHKIFQLAASAFQCEYRKEVVDDLIERHYRPCHRPLRRCHPRDLLSQVQNYCRYNDLPVEMRREHFDRVVPSYFTVVNGLPGPKRAGRAADQS